MVVFLKCEVGILFSDGIMCLLTSNKIIHFDSNNYVYGIGIHYNQFYFLLFFCFTTSLMHLTASVNFDGGLLL